MIFKRDMSIFNMDFTYNPIYRTTHIHTTSTPPLSHVLVHVSASPNDTNDKNDS